MSSRRSRERRQAHRHDVEPVIEVLAEAARRRSRPARLRAVDETTRTSTLTVRWPPTRVKLWSVRTRRIFAWVASGMSAISSRNSVPPWACSSRPGRTSSPPLLHPEQFLLDPLRASSARRLTTTNGARGARAPAVEQPRRDFLADAGRAGDQHPAAGRGDPLQRRADSVDRDAECRSARSSWPTCAAQALILAPQPFGLGRAVDQMDQPLGLERLLDEVDRPLGGSPRPRYRDCHARRSSAPGMLGSRRLISSSNCSPSSASPAARRRAAPATAAARRSPASACPLSAAVRAA